MPKASVDHNSHHDWWEDFMCSWSALVALAPPILPLALWTRWQSLELPRWHFHRSSYNLLSATLSCSWDQAPIRHTFWCEIFCGSVVQSDDISVRDRTCKPRWCVTRLNQISAVTAHKGKKTGISGWKAFVCCDGARLPQSPGCPSHGGSWWPSWQTWCTWAARRRHDAGGHLPPEALGPQRHPPGKHWREGERERGIFGWLGGVIVLSVSGQQIKKLDEFPGEKKEQTYARQTRYHWSEIQLPYTFPPGCSGLSGVYRIIALQGSEEIIWKPGLWEQILKYLSQRNTTKFKVPPISHPLHPPSKKTNPLEISGSVFYLTNKLW